MEPIESINGTHVHVNGNSTLIRVGSRKSQLALIQTNYVIQELKRIYGDHKYHFQLETITTTGDHILDTPLSQIGSKSLFTKELEDALLQDRIDFIVHSLKDLPTSLPNDCCIAAILKYDKVHNLPSNHLSLDGNVQTML